MDSVSTLSTAEVGGGVYNEPDCKTILNNMDNIL